MNNFDVLTDRQTKISADFERKWANSLTDDEFLQRMYNHIDRWECKR
ncbi:MAG: hypothetical protein LBN95_00715 [Prevotellaceae bacterium]|jgi:hypothetical protein|nr:hypothetical protein [Prevotellaceae bacterium]